MRQPRDAGGSREATESSLRTSTITVVLRSSSVGPFMNFGTDSLPIAVLPPSSRVCQGKLFCPGGRETCPVTVTETALALPTSNDTHDRLTREGLL